MQKPIERLYDTDILHQGITKEDWGGDFFFNDIIFRRNVTSSVNHLGGKLHQVGVALSCIVRGGGQTIKWQMHSVVE